MRDGLPKLKGFPVEFGGSGEIIAEETFSDRFDSVWVCRLPSADSFRASSRLTMHSFVYFGIVSAAIFAGAAISALAGFAFSAVAGAALLHLMPPTQAVPLMMMCSVIVQATSAVALCKCIQWKRIVVLACGGLIGVIPSVYLLGHVDTRLFRICFGLFVAAYALYMLLRSAIEIKPRARSMIAEGFVGLGGGVIGGLTAMPGALPTIWCDLHGISKGEQRGLVQPFILIMQIIALIWLLPSVEWSTPLLIDLSVSMPALAAGTAAGLKLFGHVDDAVFRRVVLATLLVSGLILAG
jgi:uncharacterized protein